jgi:hypothetical protein
MTFDSIVGVTQVIAVVVAAAALLVTLSGIRKQLWLTTFAEYTGRYVAIMDQIPMRARREPSRFSLEEVSGHERDDLLQLAIRYLNLCSEEYYLFRKKIVDRETWDVWRAEMVTALRRRWLVEAWSEVKAEYDSFVEFFALVEGIIAEEAALDSEQLAQLPLAS